MKERSRRAERLADLIREEIGNLLEYEVKDPRIGFVTVIGVRLSGDLHTAVVSVSILGDDEKKKEGLKGLAAAHGFLRRQLAQRLGLRYAPEVTFELDRTEAAEQRIEELLREIRPEPDESGEE
ncbi:MAG: 30S ribosome-binding factor RbfA [Acidobacteria bacterium]|nr:30S ribosome-binding factor RbfA [Acidobacteriota bacterium]